MPPSRKCRDPSQFMEASAISELWKIAVRSLSWIFFQLTSEMRTHECVLANSWIAGKLWCWHCTSKNISLLDIGALALGNKYVKNGSQSEGLLRDSGELFWSGLKASIIRWSSAEGDRMLERKRVRLSPSQSSEVSLGWMSQLSPCVMIDCTEESKQILADPGPICEPSGWG